MSRSSKNWRDGGSASIEEQADGSVIRKLPHGHPLGGYGQAHYRVLHTGRVVTYSVIGSHAQSVYGYLDNFGEELYCRESEDLIDVIRREHRRAMRRYRGV